jgi:hypothetical protein
VPHFLASDDRGVLDLVATRLFGESCSYFGRQHVFQVQRLAAALNRQPNFAVDGGLYRCVVQASGTSFACTRARSGIGGAHEAFWDIFGKKLQSIAEQVLLGLLVPTDAQAAFSQLEQFRRMLQRRANHSWLSVVRNDLQYRHEHNVWYPMQLRARDRDFLSRQATRWPNDPMSIEFGGRGGMLGEFVACCCFVVSLCYTMLTRISDRSSASKQSFVRLGPIAFLNDRAA